MEKISVVIITKNEEQNIERCIKSCLWADEIVILDSGSKDRTLEICRKYDCNIVETKWLGFGLTKQLAVSNAKNDIILSLDADEALTDGLIERISNLTAQDLHYAYKIDRRTYYCGKLINHCGWDKDLQLRLFNRKFGNFNDNALHEYVVTSQDIKITNSHILHYSYPTIAGHIEKINSYTSISARSLYEKNKKASLCKPFARGMSKFLKMYIFQLGFLDGSAGLILSINSSYGVYLKYLKLRELHKQKQKI
jgi:glycosyltransferase involved in cell wall biosynthesis